MGRIEGKAASLPATVADTAGATPTAWRAATSSFVVANDE